jgi:Ser/Thr protein kinase RdoA (MazF antagonist)
MPGTELPAPNTPTALTDRPTVTQVPLVLWSSLGRTLSRVSAALASFHEPNLRIPNDWCFEAAGATIHAQLPVLGGVLDPGQLSLLGWALAQWEEGATQQLLGRLKKQVCHGDANEMNVLVDPSCEAVVGLIDFGDACETYGVAELAIALAYCLMLEIKIGLGGGAGGGDDDTAAAAAAAGDECITSAFESGRRLVDGYVDAQARTLDADERAALAPLVTIR